MQHFILKYEALKYHLTLFLLLKCMKAVLGISIMSIDTSLITLHCKCISNCVQCCQRKHALVELLHVWCSNLPKRLVKCLYSV